MQDGGTDPICECQNGGNRDEAAVRTYIIVLDTLDLTSFPKRKPGVI